MQNNLDMIGNFYTSSDGFKFVVESINDSTANIRFLNSGITKQVSITTIKSGKVSSKITKSGQKKGLVLNTGFETVKSDTSKTKIKGIGLRLLCLDASTECTGISIYEGSKLIYADKISTSTTSGKFRKIRIMCEKIEQIIDEYKINHILL